MLRVHSTPCSRRGQLAQQVTHSRLNNASWDDSTLGS